MVEAQRGVITFTFSSWIVTVMTAWHGDIRNGTCVEVQKFTMCIHGGLSGSSDLTKATSGSITLEADKGQKAKMVVG